MIRASRLHMPAFARRWPAAVPVVLSLAMLALAFAAGMKSGASGSLNAAPTTLDALTAVLSSQVLGLEGHPYAGYEVVRRTLQRAGLDVDRGAALDLKDHDFFRNFRTPAVLKSALNAAQNIDTCGSQLTFRANNDQGLVDLFRAAFWMFGISVGAVYYFYFILLSIPVVLYLLRFGRDYRACVLLFACLCAVYAFMPSWIYMDNGLISAANQRSPSTIGIIPVLHILILIQRRDSEITWLDIATTAGQTAFICFAYAVRSTSIWMFAAVIALAAFYLAKPLVIALQARTFRANDPKAAKRASIFLIFVATALLIDAVRAMYLTPPCGTALNAHPVWHSIYYSLQFGPKWGSRLATRTGLGDNPDRPNPVPAIDDANSSGDEKVYQAVAEYVRRHHLAYQTEPTIWVATAQTQRTTTEAMPLGSWVTYEKVVRSMLFEFVRDNPRYVAENFLIVKPLLFLGVMKQFLLTVCRDLSLKRAGIFAIMVTLIILCWPFRERRSGSFINLGGIGFLLALCFAMSVAPMIVAFSATYLIADPAYIMIVSIIMLTICALLRCAALRLDAR